ncbi:MAG: class I SAM-dependent methyltransferase [Spirochaetaceae bacterium]|nr:class I SAM-dependent methyltransferase [Spirochaetaceae bacterium]
MSNSKNKLEESARLLENAGWNVKPPNQNLNDMDSEFMKIWEEASALTMISPERGWALAEAVRYVCRSGISGDIAECGVWKGGACLLASNILMKEDKDSQRRIWLYDTFSGMVSPGKEDRIASSGQALAERNPEGWWSSGLAEVKDTISRSAMDLSCFNFIQGNVEETLDNEIPEQLAVLRLDTDWYESTMKELVVLYPRLSPGGVLIIDDYGHFTGARKAVDDYFKKRGENILLHRSDYTGRVLVKNSC